MQKQINLLILVFILISSGTFFGFQEPTRKDIIDRLINEEVNRKVEKYRLTRMRKCKQKILEEGGRLADSIVIARAKGLKVLQDTIERPNAPDRPNRPDLLQPLDSSAAAPLLKDSIQLLEKPDGGN